METLKGETEGSLMKGLLMKEKTGFNEFTKEEEAPQEPVTAGDRDYPRP